jgi:hypothetical protein
MTPAEMIQSKLPPTRTLAAASKPEVLFATYGATREWTNDAPKIVRSSAEARKQFAGGIVATGFALWGITQWIARQETVECFREAE